VLLLVQYIAIMSTCSYFEERKNLNNNIKNILEITPDLDLAFNCKSIDVILGHAN